MEPHENIYIMYCHFNDIIKDLKILGKGYSLDEKNRKILNALSKDWENKVMAIEEAKDLNSMSIESLVNSLSSFELKLKSKVQEKEEAKIKMNIALKSTQEKEDSFSIDGENIEMDNNDLTLLTKNFKKFLSNKRRFKRGSQNNNNQSNSSRGTGKQEANKKQNKKCYECGQMRHYKNESSSEKKNEGRCEKIQRINNFQIMLNNCNLGGEVVEEEETAQMAFMSIGDNEVTSNQSSLDKNECDDNDDLEDFVFKLHDRTRELYAKNKELKIKINAMLNVNTRLVQDNKGLREKNDKLKKNRVDMVWNL